jgi:hypothetical protein
MAPRSGPAIKPRGSPPRERSVFINCPFDTAYLPLFDAIVLTTVSCGYEPRCALETGDVSVPRMDRILEALNASIYSIHDLSRCKGEGDDNLARFNMPLEFGIAFDKAYPPTRRRAKHDWVVLLPKGHYYCRCISDLSAYDLKTHENTVESIVPALMSWLKTRPNAQRVPEPEDVLRQFKPFQEQLDALRRVWFDNLPWKDLVQIARKCAPASTKRTSSR